ncbi:GDSL-type esterase/lipase family protein [Planococcus sp. SIMBA_160]
MKGYDSKGACNRLGKNFPSSALYQKALRRKRRNAAKPRHIDKIVILGDSVAYGYGTKGGIARHLEDSFPDSEVLNFGINGLTSDGLVERLRAEHWRAELAQADLVLLNIGGNDLLRQYQGGGASELVRQFVPLKKKYRRNLLEIYGTIRKSNEQVLIVQNSLYNSMKKEVQYFGFTNLLFRMWNSAIGSQGVVVTNTRKMGKVPSIWLDSIHPNEEGYKIMHQLLLETLQTTGIAIAKERQ